MVANFVDFVQQIFIKFASHLPSNPFSWNNYGSAFNQLLGNLNYFIPFYLFKTIVTVWLGAFSATLAIVIIIRAIRKGGMG